MPIEILMPALSPTMEKGNLAKWHVSEGDEVAAGDVIAEIETDKATMEVEAVDEGKVGKILVDEGAEDVPVNQLIMLLLEEGEDESALEDAAGKKPAVKQNGSGDGDAGMVVEKAAEPEPAKEQPKSADTQPQAAAPPPGKDGKRIFASPLARRIAANEGLDLALVSGSGPRGRIIKRDIEAALEAGTAKAGAAAQPATAPGAPAAAAPQAMADDQIKAMFEDGSYEELPHNAMRRIVAERLTESKQTIPHFYLTIDCELDKLSALRKEINESAPRDGEGEPKYKVSVNDFIIKALALALQQVPMANVTWTSGARLMHQQSDVGVAVAVPDGLFTPVIRRAEQKTLSTISLEMKDLAGRAREKKLAPHEYQGGVTAVSNLGMYGIREFSGVINPPHGTILAVGAGQQRPVVKDGSVQMATQMTVTLSCDHRVVDGALGAELLGAFRKLIENPMGMLV